MFLFQFLFDISAKRASISFLCLNVFGLIDKPGGFSLNELLPCLKRKTQQQHFPTSCNIPSGNLKNNV